MKFRRRRRVEAGMDLTPLIDVVFLLVIFLTVSTSFIRQGQLRITLPEADAGPAEDDGGRIELAVSAAGGFAIDGRVLADDRVEAIAAALRAEVAGDAARPLVIVADGRTPHELVVRAMDAAGRAGIARLGIGTREPVEPAEP